MAGKRPAERRSKPVRPGLERRPGEDLQDPTPEGAPPQAPNGDGDETAGSGSETSSESGGSGGSSDSEDGGSGDETDGTSVSEEVDIEFFDPKEADFHGIKALLQDLLSGKDFDSSGLADTVIAQSSVGTVVKSGEGEQPIGLASLLNMRRYRSLDALQQIRQHLISSCSEAAIREQLLPVLDDAGTGLLLNERVINCPPQIGPPLMQALFDEIGWAVEDEPTQELRDSFRIRQFLMVAPVFLDPLAAHQPDLKARKPPKKKTKGEAQAALVYRKPDDEFFHRHCSWSFTFQSLKETPPDELQPVRLAMMVTAEAAATARQELDDAVGNFAGSGGEAEAE